MSLVVLTLLDGVTAVAVEANGASVTAIPAAQMPSQLALGVTDGTLVRSAAGVRYAVSGLAATILALVTAATDDINQPRARAEAGAFVFGAADIGGVLFLTGAGAQAGTLPTLAPFLIVGKMLLLTFQGETAGCAPTITPVGTIDGAAVGAPFVAPVGRKTGSLKSRDGLNWFSGT